MRSRIERWRASAAGGDEELFEKRLAWDGLTPDRVAQALAGAASPAPGDWPPWARLLEEIVNETRAWTAAPRRPPPGFPVDAACPLPFEDLWLPAVRVARRRLRQSLAGRGEPVGESRAPVLSKEASLALERSLLGQLTGLAAPALNRDFSSTRPFGMGALALLLPEATATGATEHYDAFVRAGIRDGLLGTFTRYPVLARLVATMLGNWVEAVAEFVERLERDSGAIARIFGAEGPASGVEAWLSDPHAGGRTVFAVRFASGRRVIYKPRDVSLEAALQAFLSWCNAEGASPAFRTLAVLDRGSYGWVEAVERLPCPDAAAAARFYRRAGMLLSVVHALRGTDCHRENLIASGEHCVLIDGETLLHHDELPMDNVPDTTAAEAAVQRQLGDSVLRTGMLPRWEFDSERRIAYDISGLGSFDDQSMPRQGVRWSAVNTDGMALTVGAVDLPILPNVPTLDGAPLAASDHLEGIVAGFSDGYRLLERRRDALLAAGGPLDAICRTPIRFLFRATQVYAMLLESSLDPELLRGGIDRSLALEALSRAYLFARRRPEAWPIFHAEMRALERLDIPLFGGRADSTALSIGVEAPIEGYFRIPSAAEVRKQLAQFSEEDLARQVAIIRTTFRARVARPSSAAGSGDPIAAASEPLGRGALLAEAEQIAHRIGADAIRGADGSATWIDLAYVPGAERFQLQPLSPGLYDGSAGIGVFFAAWSRVSGDPNARDLALAALQPIRRLLPSGRFGSEPRLARSLGPGGVTGIGSLVYALALAGDLLGDDDLPREAARLAGLMDPQLHADDQRNDVMSGAAGAVLALLALPQDGAAGVGMDFARLWGERLLARRTGDTPRAWPTDGNVALTGFSHGAAGIAHALLCLWAATGDERFREAAGEGIAWENDRFSVEESNWPDLRPGIAREGRPGFMASWCHGAAGIGLARAASLGLPEEAVRRDGERALEGVARHTGRGSDVDHLCCGHFGRVEFLMVAAARLKRPELLERAGRLAATRVTEARRCHGYALYANQPASAASPAFFRGIAGIGWELLRLADPGTLPSVALLEANEKKKSGATSDRGSAPPG